MATTLVGLAALVMLAPGDGENGPGLDESAFRQQFSHLFRHPGAA